MRTPVVLGAFAVLQLLASFAAQVAVLRIVGIGADTDGYIAAQTVPLIVTAVIAASLQSLWLPRFSRLAGDAQALRNEQGIAQGQSSKVLLGLSLPLWASAPWWSGIAFPGFSPSQHSLVVQLGGPLFLAAVLNAQAGLLTAGLRATSRFFIAEVVTLAGTLASLAAIAILVPQFGIGAAPWITAARAAAVYLVLFWQAGRPNVVWGATTSGIEVLRQVRPLISSGMFIKSGPLVDRFWGSQAAGGGMTLLTVAQLAMNAVATILERAVLVQTLPTFAKLLQVGDLVGLKRAYFRCLRKIALAVSAAGLVLVVLRPFWSALLGGLLDLPAESAQHVWTLCMLLLPSLFVVVAASAAVAVFYAFGETRIPSLIGLAGFVLSVVLKAALFLFAGIPGIAAGVSLYLAITMFTYHIAVVRRIARAP